MWEVPPKQRGASYIAIGDIPNLANPPTRYLTTYTYILELGAYVHTYLQRSAICYCLSLFVY